MLRATTERKRRNIVQSHVAGGTYVFDAVAETHDAPLWVSLAGGEGRCVGVGFKYSARSECEGGIGSTGCMEGCLCGFWVVLGECSH